MRLIDADALVYELTEMIRHSTAEYKYGITVARLAAMDAPTVGGWISVEDRMPCENPWESEWVLVWFGEQSAIRTEAPLPGKWNPNQRTWWVVGFGEKYAELNLKITHWMPLPEPPKEGENETD